MQKRHGSVRIRVLFCGHNRGLSFRLYREIYTLAKINITDIIIRSLQKLAEILTIFLLLNIQKNNIFPYKSFSRLIMFIVMQE